jgi:hypothetical protein
MAQSIEAQNALRKATLEIAGWLRETIGMGLLRAVPKAWAASKCRSISVYDLRFENLI